MPHGFLLSYKYIHWQSRSENLQKLAKAGIKFIEELYNVKGAIIRIYDVYLYFYWLLTLLIETLSAL